MRCWPGCLAIVIKAHFPENLGAVCTVEAFDPQYQAWDCHFPRAGPTIYWNRHTGEDIGVEFNSDTACIPDDWLLPIDGPLEEEDERETEVLRITEPV